MFFVYLMKSLLSRWTMFLMNELLILATMKKIEYIILFMLLVKTISSYAQLQQYIADSDLQTMNSVKYQGKMYLYYNIFAYNGTESLPPMPFQGGRIRDGKYKASATAMNNYIEEFKKNIDYHP